MPKTGRDGRLATRRRLNRVVRNHMKLASFEAIAAALDDAGVRYLVAGGLAVNAHGYLRYTKDVDIVVQLVSENIVSAFAALATLGYKPAVPITSNQFADISVPW